MFDGLEDRLQELSLHHNLLGDTYEPLFKSDEIAKLTAGSDGSLVEADFQRTVDTLLAGGSDPVITKEPEGAWTHAITDKALN